MNPRSWRGATTAAVACLFGPLAVAQSDPFPDDWFYSGADRPAGLRALEGQEAPALSIAEWCGDAVTLADHRGKVVVVDFWATWCGPCMKAIPENVELVAAHGKDALVFVGVHDSKRGWDKVDQVIAEKKINYSIGMDDGGKSTSAFALSFWPTYVVIDKRGVVRGAGLVPTKVKDAVEKLLAEDGPAGEAKPAAGASFRVPDEWFLGGVKRSPSLRAVEGKRAPALAPAAWGGAALPADGFARQIVVYQFVRPDAALSLAPLEHLAPLASEHKDHGVAIVLVCDARGELEAAAREAAARKLDVPIAHDKALAEGKSGPGLFADSLGVRFQPATVVVDRAGTVRAAGLDPKRLRELLDQLLAEPTPAPARGER